MSGLVRKLLCHICKKAGLNISARNALTWWMAFFSLFFFWLVVLQGAVRWSVVVVWPSVGQEQLVIVPCLQTVPVWPAMPHLWWALEEESRRARAQALHVIMGESVHFISLWLKAAGKSPVWERVHWHLFEAQLFLVSAKRKNDAEAGIQSDFIV